MTWSSVRLDECTRIVSGATPSTTNPDLWDGGILWATPKDLSSLDGAYLTTTPRTISELGLRSCSAECLPPNSVLFSSRAPIGHVAINVKPTATNQGFKSFIPHPDQLESKYLYYWLRANRSYLEGLGNGATFKELSKETIARVRIQLPPLSQQRRIAAILDQAEALRTKRFRTVALFDSIREGIFYEMFGDPRTNNKRLPTGTLGKLLTLRSGDFLPASQMDFSGTYAVYGGNGINGRHSHFMFRESVISIGRVGAYCGVVHLTEPMSWVTDNSLVVAHRDPSLSDGYLLEALKIANLNQYSSQSGQPLISGSRLSKVQILVPPLERQIRFEAVLSQQARLTALGMKSAALSGQLFASLQHLAFTGEL